jgi:hypothetical protein
MLRDRAPPCAIVTRNDLSWRIATLHLRPLDSSLEFKLLLNLVIYSSKFVGGYVGCSAKAGRK